MFKLLPDPVSTFHEFSGQAGAEAVAQAVEDEDLGVDLPSAGTSMARELGFRTDRDGTRTTYYAIHDPAGTGLLAGLLPGGGEMLVQWRHTEPPEITTRQAYPAGDDESEEGMGRLTLSDPADRDLARQAIWRGGLLG